MDNEDARRWLDDEFTRLDCEPLRASGKVLLADKAGAHRGPGRGCHAAGRPRVVQPGLCRVAAVALTKPLRVDVAAMAVTF